VVLAGIASRIYVWYFSRPLWVDEEMVLLNVRDRAFAELGGALWLDQSAPVGWLALQRVVMQAFGLADRTGRAVQATAPGALWVATFALNYWWSIRHTLHSDYLQEYWLSAFPPTGTGALGAAGWLLSQLKPLAWDPGGTHLWISFWMVGACGIAIALVADVALGLLLLSAPLSAFVLGALRLVPLSGRLSLWILPALYAGIAITAECAVRWAARALARGERGKLLLAGIAGAVTVILCVDIYPLGRVDLVVQPQSNHDHNDHLAVRFLMTQRQRGDVLLTTHLTLPAVWWYAGVSIAPPNLGRFFESDADPIFEISHERSRSICRQNDFKAGLASARRVAVYFGLDSDTPGFPELVLDNLSELGAMTVYRVVANKGRVVIFDLGLPPKPWPAMTPQLPRPPGCVALRSARRW
jgi:hypothetical protein